MNSGLLSKTILRIIYDCKPIMGEGDHTVTGVRVNNQSAVVRAKPENGQSINSAKLSQTENKFRSIWTTGGFE